jgi:acyl-CoA dehydrogenase
MHFALSEDQRMMIATVRGFIADHLAPLEERVEQEAALDPALAKAIFEKSKALGLYATNIPEQFGGAGLNAVDTMLLEEQFGHTTDILIRRAFGNVYEVLLQCVGPQIERWLLPTVQGTRTCSIAITEPGAGSDAAAIATKAERSAKGWRLNGAKHYISDAQYSDFFIVSARTSSGISLFLVDKDCPGFTVGRDQAMMGLRGTSHCELWFSNVLLADDHLLGPEGKGLQLALGVLGRVRLAQVGARAVGKATHVLTLMNTYARERKQFGQAIGDFQLVQQMLADSAMEINAARWMVLHAASLIDSGRDARTAISMVKVQAAEMLGRVTDRAVQVFGGAGFCKDASIERYYRDARVYRIFDGTSEIHRGVIARALAKQGAALYDLHAQ